MAERRALALVDEDDDADDEPEDGAATPKPVKQSRDAELCRRKAIRDKLLDMFDTIDGGYVAQADRANEIMDFWDAYKSRLGGNQYYNGNSKMFIPIMASAVRARMTRFTNQCFPQSGRYVDCTTANGDVPFAAIAVMEHYIRQLRLKNNIVRPLFKSGDLEGNYSLYVDWTSHKRRITRRVKKAVEDEGEERPDFGEVDDVEEDEEFTDAGPSVEVLSDNDLLILPVTANTIEEALEKGGSVSIRWRWSKATIEAMIEEGDIDAKAGKALCEAMSSAETAGAGSSRDTAKRIAEAAGIRASKGGKFAMVCETWTKLKVGGENVICRAYFGGDDILLGCKRNPYWCDRVPIITTPVDRDAGVIKGRAPVADSMPMQIAANDAANEAADTSHFAAMPIVMADPEKNPKSATMILDLGAVWDVDPNSVKFANFPPLYKELLEVIGVYKSEIFQNLGVNPSMMPQSSGSGKSKRNQAEIALEQQVDLLTTAEAVGVMEDVLNQMLQRFCDYDHQFRDKPMTVRAFGPMGRRANMESIEPLQDGAAYEFIWLGVESARNAAMAQQQISYLATLAKLPPDKLPNYKIDLSSAVLAISMTQLGPRLAPLTLVSLKDQQGLDAKEENEQLVEGFALPVHPTDDDVEHIREHFKAFKETGDPTGNIKMHVAMHNMQRQAKATAAAQAQAKSGGAPGGGDAGPQAGAKVGPPRAQRAEPGSISQDGMAAAGAPGMPRKERGAAPAV